MASSKGHTRGEHARKLSWTRAPRGQIISVNGNQVTILMEHDVVLELDIVGWTLVVATEGGEQSWGLNAIERARVLSWLQSQLR